MSGKFIVVEGLEGAGKTTAISHIKKLLDSKNISNESVREPGGTKVGEKLREILKDNSCQIAFKTELLLMYAARIELLENIILPKLQQGIWIIADRFELSSFAYQGGGRGLDKNFIALLSKFCIDGFKPDLMILLDIEPQLGMTRVKLRGEKIDRFEAQNLEFFEQVAKVYRTNKECKILNAQLPLSAINHKLELLINELS